MSIGFSCGFRTDFHSGASATVDVDVERKICNRWCIASDSAHYLYLRKKREEFSDLGGWCCGCGCVVVLGVRASIVFMYTAVMSPTNHQSGNRRPLITMYAQVAQAARHSCAILRSHRRQTNRSMPFIPFLSVKNCLSSHSIAPPQMNELIWNAISSTLSNRWPNIVGTEPNHNEAEHTFLRTARLPVSFGQLCASFPSSHCLVNRLLVSWTIFWRECYVGQSIFKLILSRCVVWSGRNRTQRIVDNNESVWTLRFE